MTSLVDVHSHLYPLVYLELLRKRDRYPRVVSVDGVDRFIVFPDEDDPEHPTGRPISESFWSVEAKLSFMDEAQITQTVLSIGNPWLDPFPGGESIEYASEINAEMGAVEQRTDGRVVGMAVLPNAGIDDAVRTVREVSADWRLRGIVTGPRICGHTLDDNELEPLWAALSSSRVPWMLHPSDGFALSELEGFGHSLPIALGFPFETTIAVSRLALAGVLERHPGIRLIASHGGGTLPFLAGRLDAVWRTNRGASTGLSLPPSRSLARLHADAITFLPQALSATHHLVGDKLSFGTDHPFAVSDPTGHVEAIAKVFETEPETAHRIRFRHACELFRLDTQAST